MKIKITVAVAMQNFKFLMSMPKDLEKDYYEGVCVEDNCWIGEKNEHLIPDEPGVYECECECTTEGMTLERIKEDYNKKGHTIYIFEITKVTPLYKI